MIGAARTKRRGLRGANTRLLEGELVFLGPRMSERGVLSGYFARWVTVNALEIEGESEPAALSKVLSRWSAGRLMVKRFADLLAGFLALVLVLPLMVAVVVAIMIDSRGWPIYVQHRLGRAGTEFALLKFRTMVKNADQRCDEFFGANSQLILQWQNFQKVRHDPRITRVGRILRKYSLDEMPQLINVAMGHMSLVGPRPVLDGEIERFGDDADLILSVRPGLTGLWAVNGRSDLTYEERAALEARYVREFNLLLDVRILIKTIPRVLGGKGAC